MSSIQPDNLSSNNKPASTVGLPADDDLAAILRLAAISCKAEAAAIFIEKGNYLRASHTYGFPDQNFPEDLELSHFPDLSNNLVLIADASKNHPIFINNPQIQTGGFKFLVAAELQGLAEDHRAILTILRRKPAAFSEDHSFALKSCRDQIMRLSEKSKNRFTQEQLEQTLYHLTERNKEQTCVFKITQLCGKGLEPGRLLPKAAEIIRLGLQYPKLASVQISFDGKTYSAGPGNLSTNKLSCEKITASNKKLCICASYSKELEQEKNMFLAEEKLLLDAVANTITTTVNQFLIQLQEQLLLKSTEEGIYGIDNEGLCTFINPAAAALLGYSPDECIGRNMHRLIHSRKADNSIFPEHECPIYLSKDSLLGCRVEDDLFWHKNGEAIPVRYSSTPIVTNGKIEGAVIVFSDTTHLKNSQKQLTEEREALQHILDSSLDVICTIDGNLQFKTVSAASMKMWGYKPGELLTVPVTDLVVEKDRQAFLDFAAEVFQGKQFRNFRTRFLHKNGNKVPLSWSAFWNKEMQIMHCVARDASDRKNLERQITWLTNNTKEAFVLVDKSYKIVSFNNQFSNSYEKHLRRKVRAGDNILDYSLQGREDYLRKLYDRVFQGAEETVELTIPTTGNEVLIFKITYKPARDEYNEIVGAFVSISDITSERTFSEKLEKSERVFKALVQEGSELISILDKDANYLYVGPSSARLLGTEPEEYYGKNAFEFIHPDDQEEVNSNFEKLGKQKYVTIKPFRFLHKNGTWRWIETVATDLLDDPAVGGIVANSRDITEKVQREEQLLRSKSRFEALLREGADLVVVLEPDGTIQYASSNFPGFTGYTAKQLVGKDFFRYIHPDDRELVNSEYQQLKSKRRIQASPYRYRRKDGKWRWMRSVATNLCEEPSVKGIIVNSIDITDIIETQVQLKHSEARYKGFYESQTNFVIRTDIQGNYSYVNRRLAEVFGWLYPDGKIIGKNSLTSICSHHHSRVMDIVEKCLMHPGKVYKVELDKPARNRTTVTTLWDFICIADAEGKPSEIQCMGIDITYRIVMEKELQNSNERFNLVMQAGSESIWEFYPDTGELFLGDGFRRNFGVAISKLKENNAIVNNLVHPEDKEEFLKKFQNTVYNTSNKRWKHEYRLQKKNGQYAYVRDKALILRDENKKAIRVVGAVKDITIEHFYQQLENIEKEIMTLSFSREAMLSEILKNYIQKIESLLPEVRIMLLKIENNRFFPVASPSLPAAFTSYFNGKQVDGDIGPCSEAFSLGRSVAIENVLAQDRWPGYRQLAADSEFSACWAQPVFNAGNKVVAVLSNYYRSPRKPTQTEKHSLERAQRLISVLLAKAEYLEGIQKSNERYELVNQTTNDALYEWNIGTNALVWGDNFFRIFGYQRREKGYGISSLNKLIHRSDRLKDRARFSAFLADKAQSRWHSEFRFCRADSSYAFVEEFAHVIRDPQGNALHMIGVIRDVTDLKSAAAQKQIQHQVSQFFSHNIRLNTTLQSLLKYLTETGDFKAAEVWLNTKANTFLTLSSIYAQDDNCSSFIQKSLDLKRLQAGEGLPGKAWEEKETIVWDRIDELPDFKRMPEAREAGLKAALAIPMWHNETVMGVLILYSDNYLNNDTYKTSQYLHLRQLLGGEIIRKQQEEEMYLLFQSSPDILAIATANGRFLKVNPSFCNLLGFSEEELTSQPFTNFIHPHDLASTQGEYLSKLLSNTRSSNFINRYRTKDGSYRYISWGSSHTFGDEGHIFAFGRDVTEIRKLQDLLDRATSLSKVGGWEIDFAGDRFFWSDMTRRIYEVAEDFVPDISSSLLFYKEGHSRNTIAQCISEAILNGTSWDVELQIISARGHEKWVRSIGNAELSENRCIRIYGSLQDIDDRKLTELRLQNISNNVPGIIFQYLRFGDGSDQLKYISEGAREIWGLEPHECVESTEKVLRGIAAGGDSKKFRRSVAKSAARLSPWHETWRYVKPNGDIRIHEVQGNPHKTADGTVVWDAIIMDITDKHKLKELAERTSKIARIGSWEMNLLQNKTDAMYWSQMTKDLFGVPLNYQPTLNSNLQFFEEPGLSEIKSAFKKLMSDGDNFELDLPIKNSRGQRRWIRCIGRSEWIGDYCSRIYGSYQDIHAQKTAELELQKALAEKTTILESVGDAFFTVDHSWTVLYWNKEAERVLATPRGKIIGQSLWEVFHDAKNTAFYQNYQKALESGQPVHFEELYKTTNQWLEVSVYPSEQGLAVYFKDITIRKAAQEQLRQTNERFEIIVEATNDAIWDYDPISGVLLWGKGFKTLFGYNPQQITPTFDLYLSLIHPQDKKRITEKVTKVFADPAITNWFEEYRILKANQKYALIIDRAVFIRDKEGKVTRVVGAITDISYRKEYEESLKELYYQLEVHARKLAISNAELEQFAYVASHDLQEPLRMVSSFLTQLNKKYGDKLDDKAKQYIHYAVDGSKRMRQIILDLLDYSRVGRHEGEKEMIDLRQIVKEVATLQRKLIEEKSAVIEVKELPVIHNYKTPVLQIFQNLIGNGLKYSRNNIPPKIELSTKEEENRWVILFKDNGIGIEEQHYTRIFTIFQRLHGRTEYEGTGMGLAIVKKITDNMGAKIWLESEPDKGSTFFIELPKTPHDYLNLD